MGPGAVSLAQGAQTAAPRRPRGTAGHEELAHRCKTKRRAVPRILETLSFEGLLPVTSCNPVTPKLSSVIVDGLTCDTAKAHIPCYDRLQCV